MAAASNFDFWMVDEGTMIGLRAISLDAKDWMHNNIQDNVQKLGDVQYIDNDCAWIILEDLLKEGYVITSPRGNLEFTNA